MRTGDLAELLVAERSAPGIVVVQRWQHGVTTQQRDKMAQACARSIGASVVAVR
jgi:hypothetical protein